MLDRKSINILKVLNKLAEGNAYKVVTTEEIIATINQKSQYDKDNIKDIIDFLEKQEYVNIKFSEENTYCYSLLPKARIFLEQNGKQKSKKPTASIVMYVYTMISSFVGSLIAILTFFYLTF